MTRLGCPSPESVPGAWRLTSVRNGRHGQEACPVSPHLGDPAMTAQDRAYLWEAQAARRPMLLEVGASARGWRHADAKARRGWFPLPGQAEWGETPLVLEAGQGSTPRALQANHRFRDPWGSWPLWLRLRGRRHRLGGREVCGDNVPEFSTLTLALHTLRPDRGPVKITWFKPPGEGPAPGTTCRATQSAPPTGSGPGWAVL